MPKRTLPQLADARKLATSAALFEGDIALEQLPRVCEVLADSAGVVSYRLLFGFDDEGYLTIEGRMSATVSLFCERCLQAMPQPIESTFTLAVVASDEQANQLPERYEPLVLVDGIVNAATIIEDEVLLCLPIVALHSERECARQKGFTTQDSGYERAASAAKVNPFDALGVLKKK